MFECRSWSYNVYFHCPNIYIKVIQPPNINRPIIFQKSDILAYFALVPLYRGGDLHYWCQKFSESSFLVCFHCQYGLYQFIVQVYRTYYLYYLVLYCSSHLCAAYYHCFAALTQIIHSPCNTNESGGSRHFLLPVSPQEKMLMLLIRQPLPLVLTSHPHPIQPTESHFIPLYQPVHKKTIFPSEFQRTDTIQPLHLKSQLANTNTASRYHYYLCSTLVLPIGNTNKSPIMQPVPQKPISPRENHLFRNIHPDPAQDPMSLP